MSIDVGRFGTWSSQRQWPTEPDAIGEAARVLEVAGFSTAWIGGGPGGSQAHFDLVEAILAGSTTLVVATAIVEVWSTPSAEVLARHHGLASRYPGRFLLGLGAGHAEAVEPTTGQQYVKPLSKLRSYLDELDAATDPLVSSERVLAALGPRMLQLAAERSIGAHTYEVTPEHTAAARSALGPGPLLAPEQKVVIESDPHVARAFAREAMAIHLLLPNYLASWRRLGMDDADFADGGSDRLMDALVAWGSPSAVAGQVQEHIDAGASHVALQVLGPGGGASLPLEGWSEAAALLG